MGDVTFVTRELDISAFHSGIFMSNADMLSPVAIYPRGEEFQTLQDYCDETNTHPGQWASGAGPAGIGQYSLVKNVPAGVLARFDVHFRHPTDEEMRVDFDNFGDQVLGPVVEEVPEAEKKQYKGNTAFGLWGKQHYFMGPPRLVKSMFLTRVFPGELPSTKDIARLIEEVDGIAETGEMIVPQGYQFLHATRGEVLYLPFGKTDKYDPTKLTTFGSVEIEDGRMTYYPGGDRDSPIDFTISMYNHRL